MPQDDTQQTVTLYSPKSGKSQDFKGSGAVKKAISVGWVTKPPAQAAAGAQQGGGADTGTGGGAGGGTGTPSGGGAPTGLNALRTGIGHGLNPVRSVPSGMPTMSHGVGPVSNAVGDMAADMFNLRESKYLMEHGRKTEGIGLGIGTGAGLVGSDLLKAAGEGFRGLKLGGEPLTRLSLIKAKQLQKTIGGAITDARLAEGIIQPIREGLYKLFEPLHAALAGEKIPLSATAKQKIINIARNEPETVKEISDLYRETGRTTVDAATSSQVRTTAQKAGKGIRDVGKVGKTTRDTVKDTRYVVRPDLDYKSADAIVTRLRSIERDSPQAGLLADEIEKEIDKAAAKKGLSAQRTQLKGWYHRMSEIEYKAAGDINRSLARQLLRETKIGRKLLLDKPEVGKDTAKAAEALMAEIRGQARNKVLDAIGTITKQAAQRYKQLALGWRATTSALSKNAPEKEFAEK